MFRGGKKARECKFSGLFLKNSGNNYPAITLRWSLQSNGSKKSSEEDAGQAPGLVVGEGLPILRARTAPVRRTPFSVFIGYSDSLWVRKADDQRFSIALGYFLEATSEKNESRASPTALILPAK